MREPGIATSAAKSPQSERGAGGAPPAPAAAERALSFVQAGGNQAFLKALGRTNGIVVQRKCAKCEEEEEETIGMQEGAPEAQGPTAVQESTPAEGVETPESPTGTEPLAATPVPGLLVEDDAEDVGSSQMKKTEFLDILRPAVCAAVDRGLTGTGRNSDGCPHVEFWFEHLAGKHASFIERGIQRFAPEARGARSAGEYIPAIASRVQVSTEIWATTGRIEGVPEEFAAAAAAGATPPDGGVEGQTGERVQFKARRRGAKLRHNPAVMRDQLGKGRPLDGGVLSRMESAFGTSLGHVRLHDDSRAATLASDVNARAFAVGNHIAFGSGEYRPGTLLGDALIAHELVHVVQQEGVSERTAPKPGEAGGERLEGEADRVAAAAVASLWSNPGSAFSEIRQNAVPRLRSGLRLQRCKDAPAPTPKIPKLTFSVVGGPTPIDCGGFSWACRWSVQNATAATNGWIVQKLEHVRDVKDCTDKPVPFKAPGIDPSWFPFWEAWQVRGGKVFVGDSAQAHNADTYSANAVGDSTKGSLTAKGTADYYDGLTLPKSFVATNAAPTWALPTTKTDPALTGGSGALDHTLTAKWDCCTATKTTTLTTSSPP